MCVAINGSEIAQLGDPHMSLLDFPHEQLHLNGTKSRGATRAHAACTLLADGEHIARPPQPKRHVEGPL